MSIVYVSHKYDGKKEEIREAMRTTYNLQLKDLINHYYCPLVAIPWLAYKDISDDDKTALKLDMLTVCDSLLIASDISEDMKDEIEFAKLVKMEVLRLEEDGTIRPFKE
jgi:hypothetical protein